MNNTMCATSGTGTTHPSKTTEFVPTRNET